MMEDLQSEGDVSHKDDDPFASVPGTLSKFLTGDLSFEEFSKTSLVEELMASDESGADDDGDGLTEGTQKEESSADHDVDRHSSSPAQNDPSGIATDQAQTFVTELSSIQTARRRKLITGSQSVLPSNKKRKLPSHLHAVMGEANLRLARGDPAGAQKLCKEVIRQAPQIASPYLTLAMAYEETGDIDKHYQLSLIAAHLQQKNYDLWIKLAGLALERNNLRDATLCISKAIRLNPYNIELLEQKATLLIQMGDHKRALECFETILTNTTVKSGQRFLDNMKMMARCCHDLNLYSRAIEVLTIACSAFQGSPDHEVVNILAELYLLTKQHHKIYELIVKYYCEHTSEEMPHKTVTAPPTTDSLHTEPQQHHQGDETQPSLNIDTNNSSTVAHTQNNITFHPPLFTNTVPALPMAPPEAVESNQNFSINLSTAVEMSMQLDTDPDFMNNFQMTPIMAAEEEAGLTQLEEPAGSHQTLRVKDDIPIDLRVKLIVSMIYLGEIPTEDILGPLISEDPEHCGDLYLDIAEAYMENGHPSLALSYLSALVKTNAFNQAGVWLKHADCLHQMGDLEEAANSYAAVLHSVPHHTEARLKLVEVYVALGRSDDALAILDQESLTVGEEEVEIGGEEEGDQTEDPGQQTVDEYHSQFTLPHQDIRLSYQKFLLLQSEGQLEESLDVSNELLMCYFRNIQRLNMIMFNEKRRAKKRPPNITEAQEKELKKRVKVLSKDEWYTVFIKTCYAMYTLQQYGELRKWLITAVNSGHFEKHHNDLYVMTISVCLTVNDFRNAYLVLKNFYRSCTRYPDILWIFHSRFPLVRYMVNYRLILRKLVKEPYNPLLLLLIGNLYYLKSNYLNALGFYKEVHRLQPDNALTHLLIGLCFIGMVGKSKGAKFARYRNALILQAFAFIFKYGQLQGDSQEAYYNLGRAFHHMGLVHIAVDYYKRVLITPPSHLTRLSLCREAAYNLSLIYRDSGNLTLARLTLQRYFTI